MASGRHPRLLSGLQAPGPELRQAIESLAATDEAGDPAAALALAASLLPDRDSGRIVGLDRIAVMAALNMANDLLHAQARDKVLEGDISDRLKLISDRVESVLGDTQQLDL